MATNNIELRSIRSLSGLNFFIPDYQRGYRWSDGQVKQMLNDFKEFCKRIDDKQVKAGEFYCLQPIVVKKRTQVDIDGNQIEEYEVIDGQQRLTTLYIILKSLEQICQVLYSQFRFYTITYETRLEYDSQKYLQNINSNPTNADEFIDFYYMKLVHDAVTSWFEANPDYKPKIASALLDQSVDYSTTKIDKANNVRVIWYEVMGEESATSIDIFTRLNIGKIPLTNAELIKALLLRRGNFVDTDVTMKQLQIATEWNHIEQKLQDNSFWYFLYRTDNPFTYENRIEFIFDLMKNRTKDSEFYHTFNEFNNELEALQQDKNHYRNDQARIDKIWDGVKEVFQTFEEWFEDRTLYHYIGFLIEYKSDINALIKASKSMGKIEFLNEHIKNEISKKIAGINLDELSFNDSKDDIRKVLLLFNILTVLQDKKSDMRFPFNKYKVGKWDIEHVCSQTDKLITDEKQRRLWITDMFEYFVGSSSEEDIENYLYNLKYQIEQYDDNSDIQDQANCLSLQSELDVVTTILKLSKTEGKINNTEFDEAFKKVQSLFKEDMITDKDSIANLALLDQETNRSYGNAYFPVKRKRIISNDKKGVFVPIATKNLFLKYYSRKSNSLMSWQESDAYDYLDSIKSLVTPFI